MKIRLLSGLVCAVAVSSCVPDIDTDKFNNANYRGEWAVPLVNASVSLEDVLAEDTLFTVDPDGGLRIIYESDSLVGFSIDDFAAIPSQDPLSTTVPLDVPSISVSSSLGTIADAEFKELVVRDGKLSFDVDNQLAGTVDLRVSINNATINGQVFQVSLTAPSGVSTTEVNVAGLTMDLSNNNTTSNYISFDIEVLNNGGAVAGETVDLTMEYKDLLVGRAVGYFGQRTVNVPSGNFNLGVEAFENFLNGLYLANPTVELVVSTNVVLPLQLNLDMDGVNSAGQLSSLGLDPIVIPGPTNIGDFDTTRVIIDRTTSNIVDFIANVPNTILYSGQGEMNSNGNTGVDNFITADGEMQIGLKLDLPLSLRTQDLIFVQDLTDLDFGGLNEQTDAVEKLTLIFNIDNEFPFDADMKLRFYDAAQTLTDSVMLDLFDAAPVDANGRSTGYAVTREEEELTSVEISRLLRAKRIEMIITLNTTDNGNTTVKLYNDYDIKVRLGVIAKLDYDI